MFFENDISCSKTFPPIRAILLLQFILTIQGCLGINCYTCASINGSNPHCEDPINTNLTEYTEKCMVPKKNHIGLFPANFCIKITGVNTITYSILVIRACVMKTMDSQCGMFKYEDQAMSGCVLTCDYNGCNKSNKIIAPVFCLFCLVFLLRFLVRQFTSSVSLSQFIHSRNEADFIFSLYVC